MKKLITSGILLTLLIFSGCTETNNEAYRKISLYADISLSHSPTTGENVLVCLGNGTLSSIMYFDKYGGKIIEQESTLTLNNIGCENFGTAEACTASTDPSEISIPVTLDAKIIPEAIQVISSDGEEKLQDQFLLQMTEPANNPVEITYNCGGSPSTMSDYGATFSQLSIPFTLTQWDFGIQADNAKISTIKEYETFNTKATIEFGILEEFTDSL